MQKCRAVTRFPLKKLVSSNSPHEERMKRHNQALIILLLVCWRAIGLCVLVCAFTFFTASVRGEEKPTIHKIEPEKISRSNQKKTFTIHGSNFLDGASVTLRRKTNNWTFTNRPIFSLSATQIVLRPIFSGVGDWTVEVINPDGNSSGESAFRVHHTPITPVIDGVTPNPVIGANRLQHLTINGHGFVEGYTVVLRTRNTAERYVYYPTNRIQTEFQITLPIYLTENPGPWSFQVVNPGGYESNVFPFDVVAPGSLAKSRFYPRGLILILSLAVAVLAVGWSCAQWRFWPRRCHTAQQEGMAYERAQFARDLHDRVGSGVSQIAVLSEQLKFEIPQSPELEPVRSQIQRINAAVRSVVQDIDDMIWAAKPENGRLEILLPRLRQKASEVLDQAGIRCEVDFPIPLPAHPVEARFCSNLLLFTKEAVHNIIKHSGATLAQMRLTMENQQLTLSIQDNGRGLPAPPEGHSGSGLKNMRDRAGEMNGQFSLTPVSIAGSGTEVRLRVPLPGMTHSGRESGTQTIA